jgi:hypothetical protein
MVKLMPTTKAKNYRAKLKPVLRPYFFVVCDPSMNEL